MDCGVPSGWKIYTTGVWVKMKVRRLTHRSVCYTWWANAFLLLWTCNGISAVNGRATVLCAWFQKLDLQSLEHALDLEMSFIRRPELLESLFPVLTVSNCMCFLITISCYYYVVLLCVDILFFRYCDAFVMSCYSPCDSQWYDRMRIWRTGQHCCQVSYRMR